MYVHAYYVIAHVHAHTSIASIVIYTYIAAVVAHQKIICISMRSMIPSGTSNSRQTAKISGNLLMHLHRLTMLHTSEGQVTGLMGIHTFSISKGAFYDYSNSTTSIMYYQSTNYVHIHTCMLSLSHARTHAHTHARTHTHTYAHTHTQTHTRTHRHTHTHAHTHTHTHTLFQCVHSHCLKE